jgi:hypothetical protein
LLKWLLGHALAFCHQENVGPAAFRWGTTSTPRILDILAIWPILAVSRTLGRWGPAVASIAILFTIGVDVLAGLRYRGDRQVARIGNSPAGNMKPLNHPNLHHDTTPPIYKLWRRLSAIESLGEGEKLSHQEIADRYDVNRSTLSRRRRGVQRSMKEYAVTKQLLSPH